MVKPILQSYEAECFSISMCYFILLKGNVNSKVLTDLLSTQITSYGQKVIKPFFQAAKNANYKTYKNLRCGLGLL